MINSHSCLEDGNIECEVAASCLAKLTKVQGSRKDEEKAVSEESDMQHRSSC